MGEFKEFVKENLKESDAPANVVGTGAIATKDNPLTKKPLKRKECNAEKNNFVCKD